MFHRCFRDCFNCYSNLRRAQGNIAASNDRNHRRTLEILTETQTIRGSSGAVRMPAVTVRETEKRLSVPQSEFFNGSEQYNARQNFNGKALINDYAHFNHGYRNRVFSSWQIYQTQLHLFPGFLTLTSRRTAAGAVKIRL